MHQTHAVRETALSLLENSIKTSEMYETPTLPNDIPYFTSLLCTG